MKAVLISIQPKWCELIASGKKTIEVRKTRPKIKTPFRCYIYKTMSGGCPGDTLYEKINHCITVGKVIGEFVCKSILPISVTYSDPNSRIALREFPYTCLTDKEIIDYLGNGKQGWGWVISNLVIYDKPKELSEFYSVDNEAVQNCKHRLQTYHQFTDTGYIKNGFVCTRNDDWCTKCKTKPLTRPPQSWCYVEEVE